MRQPELREPNHADPSNPVAAKVRKGEIFKDCLELLQTDHPLCIRTADV
jgi:hypothetical protein